VGVWLVHLTYCGQLLLPRRVLHPVPTRRSSDLPPVETGGYNTWPSLPPVETRGYNISRSYGSQFPVSFVNPRLKPGATIPGRAVPRLNAEAIILCRAYPRSKAGPTVPAAPALRRNPGRQYPAAKPVADA